MMGDINHDNASEAGHGLKLSERIEFTAVAAQYFYGKPMIFPLREKRMVPVPSVPAFLSLHSSCIPCIPSPFRNKRGVLHEKWYPLDKKVPNPRRASMLPFSTISPATVLTQKLMVFL